MKRKLFSFSCCLVVLLTTILTSCQQEAPIPEMVTVSYVSEFGTLEKTEKIVEKGYKLKAEDLPALTETGYTFDKWYINKVEAKVGTVINKDTVLVAKWNKVLDKTAPAEATFGEITAKDGKAVISWTNPKDTDFKGIELSVTPNHGTLTNPVTLNKEVTSFSVADLTNGTKYTFKIRTFDNNSNYSKGIKTEATPSDTSDKKAPANATLSVKSEKDGIVVLNWTKPSDSDLKGYKLSATPNHGTIVNPITLDKDVSSFTVSGLTNGKEYTFTLQSFDNSLNYSVGATATATPTDTSDKTAPAEVTAYTATNLDGTVALSWTDPADKDLFGIEITYTPKSAILSRSIEKMVEESIFIAPKTQYVEIPKLTNGTEYTFTLKTMDLSGNKSKGVTVICTPEIIEGKPMEITLTPTVTEPTNKAFNVNVEINTGAKLATVKFAPGEKQVQFFETDGDACTKDTSSETKYTFRATGNGIYTVFAQDVDGRREVKTIEITNIDTTAPMPVENLKATYSDATGVGIITITWDEPQDSDFAEVLLRYSDGRDIASVKKGIRQYEIEGIKADNTTYTICAYSKDEAGNYDFAIDRKTEVKAVSTKVRFSSITLPKIGTAIKTKTIDAIVKGRDFNTATPSDYILTCSENSTLVKNASIKIVDNETIKVAIPTDGIKAGAYTVTISCIGYSTSCKLIVKDSSKYNVGDILLNDGNPVAYGSYTPQPGNPPVAVVCGFSEYGIPLGLGLKQSENKLMWGLSTTMGYWMFETKDIICTPSTNFVNTATFTGDIDGSDNWSLMVKKYIECGKSLENALADCPAFAWVNNYGASLPSECKNEYKVGWYMPSIAELAEICKNKNIINEALNKLGTGIASSLLNDRYWSSSQSDYQYGDAMNLYFQNGTINRWDMNDERYVRCVRSLY